MDFIAAGKDRKDLGFLGKIKSIDLELGDNNDFELIAAVDDADAMGLEFGSYIYIPGTEYGGVLEEKAAVTNDTTVTWRGYTWRGLLEKIILSPPPGGDYLTVSGDANTVIYQLLKGNLAGFLAQPAAESGVEVNYQFERYCTALSGLSAMLNPYGCRLDIKADCGAAGEAFVLGIECVPITDFSEEIEYSQDNRVTLTIEDNRRGINHLICLGKGELSERQVLHLYAQADGSIGETPFFTGMEERSAVYDASSSESLDDLRKDGIKELTKQMNYKKLSMEVDDLDLEIGDYVAGRDRKTGAYLKKPIKGKILRMEGAEESIEYKVEGED